jgi:hypothetical protein
MAKRKLLKEQDRRKLFDISVDEDSLIRHYSLSPADRLEIEVRRRDHNRLGFAIQLCLMRYPGRVLGAEEAPPRAMLRYVADQIGADQASFALYSRRDETRRDHAARLLVYLDIRSATAEDRRGAIGRSSDGDDVRRFCRKLGNAVVNVGYGLSVSQRGYRTVRRSTDWDCRHTSPVACASCGSSRCRKGWWRRSPAT